MLLKHLHYYQDTRPYEYLILKCGILKFLIHRHFKRTLKLITAQLRNAASLFAHRKGALTPGTPVPPTTLTMMSHSCPVAVGTGLIPLSEPPRQGLHWNNYPHHSKRTPAVPCSPHLFPASCSGVQLWPGQEGPDAKGPWRDMGRRKIWTLILFPWWETNTNHFFSLSTLALSPLGRGGLEARPRAGLGSGRATSAPIA